MGLSSDIISQFVKITNDTKTETPKETTVYGTTVTLDGKTYVKIDGSELLTPVNSTVSTNDGDKVTVVVGNHTATITGNITDPSASSKVVEEQGSMVQEFETVVAYKVTTKDLEAVNAAIENLRVVTAKIQDATIVNATIERLYAKLTETDKLTATDIKAITAEIETLRVEFGKFGNLSAEDAEIVNAEITNLEGYTADFTYVIADELEAVNANIRKLDSEKLTAKEADLKYANIDFANINEAAVKKIFSDYGIIKELIISEGTVVKELVGVTIKGDLIEAGTVKADKLVVKGSDGLYYKLNIDAGVTTSEEVTEEQLQNGLSGSVIIAKSITAEKVRVEDLVAFDATIGGFEITDDSIHSVAKDSVDNTTMGIYLDKEGQANFGDGNRYLKFFKDGDGNYKLNISADELRFAASGKTVEETINGIKIGGRNLLKGTRDFSGFYSNRSTTGIVSEDQEYTYVNFPVVETLDYRAISSTYSMLDAKDVLNREVVLSFELRSDDPWTSTGSNILIGFALCGDDSTTRLRYSTPHFTEEITTEWVRHSLAVTLNDEFFVNGTTSLEECTRFYVQLYNYSLNQLQVRKFKLEYGTISTDWSPAIEDMVDPDDLNNTKNEIIQHVSEQVADINVTNNTIAMSVKSLEEDINTQINETIDSIERLQKNVDLKMDAESVKIEIQKVVDNGTSKVDTGTGFTFNDEGLTIDKKDSDGKSISQTNTKITENGMTVNSAITGQAVLTANKDGVDAENLHATTYLIINGKSRFEKYGENRIGCFWIG